MAAKRKAKGKAKSKAKAKGKAGRKAAPKAGEPLVVVSKAKAVLKAAGCNSSSDAFDALNNYVHWLLGQASQRASANGRKTVRAHDFMA